jgi:hypothetical protein
MKIFGSAFCQYPLSTYAIPVLVIINNFTFFSFISIYILYSTVNMKTCHIDFFNHPVLKLKILNPFSKHIYTYKHLCSYIFISESQFRRKVCCWHIFEAHCNWCHIVNNFLVFMQQFGKNEQFYYPILASEDKMYLHIFLTSCG